MGQMIQQVGAMRSWIVVAILQMALILCTTFATASDTNVTRYDGEKVTRLNKERLTSEGHH